MKEDQIWWTLYFITILLIAITNTIFQNGGVGALWLAPMMLVTWDYVNNKLPPSFYDEEVPKK